LPRSRGFRSLPSQKRRTGWEEGPFGVLAFTTSGQSSVFGTAQAATQDGLTLIRIRGELLVFLSNATAALDGFSRVAAGLCIVSENAAGIGATAIPDPLVDIAWDGWIWHKTFSVVRAGSALVDDAALTRIQVDSKAMRKFKSSDVLVGMFSAGTEVGTATLQAMLTTRLLVKLP